MPQPAACACGVPEHDVSSGLSSNVSSHDTTPARRTALPISALARGLVTLVLALFVVSCSGNEATTPPEGPRPEHSAYDLVLTNVTQAKAYAQSGAATMPDGLDGQADLFPGERYSFSFFASPGLSLSFATKLLSARDHRDRFVAPNTTGMPLFVPETGTPIGIDEAAEQRDALYLWDAGLYAEATPSPDEGEGNSEPPPDPDPRVRKTSGETGGETVGENSTLPPIADILSVRIASSVENGAARFEVTFENTADPALRHEGMPIAFSPLVYVVHEADAPLFQEDAPMRDNGLRALVDTGDPLPLTQHLAARTGITFFFSPWIHAQSSEGVFWFGPNAAHSGLESLAEEGDPTAWQASWNLQRSEQVGAGEASIISSTSVPSSDPSPGDAPDPDSSDDTPGSEDDPDTRGPNWQTRLPPGSLAPGQSHRVRLTRDPSSTRWHVAAMLMPSNDYFVSFPPEGLPWSELDAREDAHDLTNALRVWNAGTEANETIPFGPTQIHLQSQPGEGAPDPLARTRPVQDKGFPPTSDLLRLELIPVPAPNTPDA